MTQHLYSAGGAVQAVPDLGNITDLPICLLPIAAIGLSPAMSLIDCQECLRRAVTSTEEWLVMLRALLAKTEATS